ncbi:uncharacterized protein LOC126845534 [Adelges cooleyi]|uniref:uncharacterized protein LOC126845534 n=1 Tax=Adelges cooleyi TaxID=133065 RepID=UPI00217FEAD9|nr:uncharacterized protein LOC126845534 [Adelges cooleyi]
MIAVPELPQMLNLVDLVESLPFKDIQDNSMHYQNEMQLKIKKLLGLVDEPAIDETQKVDLEILGQKRRNCTRPVLENIIQRVLDQPEQDVWDNATLRRVCRMLGIYISAQFPESHINILRIKYSLGDCILYHGPQEHLIYKKQDGAWGQLKEDGSFHLLKDQLAENRKKNSNDL